MSNLSQMVHCGLHLNDKLKNLLRLTCFLQEVYSHFANLGCGIIQLCKQEAKRPGICIGATPNQLSQVIRCIKADMLSE
jgi:hypothetical protein